MNSPKRFVARTLALSVFALLTSSTAIADCAPGGRVEITPDSPEALHPAGRGASAAWATRQCVQNADIASGVLYASVLEQANGACSTGGEGCWPVITSQSYPMTGCDINSSQKTPRGSYLSTGSIGADISWVCLAGQDYIDAIRKRLADAVEVEATAGME